MMRRADEPPPADDARAWIGGALPRDWFEGPATVSIDRDEILIVGRLSAPDVTDENDRLAAEQGRIAGFRETTRAQRIGIAQRLERRYHRKVAWGVEVGGQRELFTNHSVPVMTRLRQQERLVLDTLVDAGVARSRSEALYWCVALVGKHTETWLTDLRGAMTQVEELRKQGPDVEPRKQPGPDVQPRTQAGPDVEPRTQAGLDAEPRTQAGPDA